MTPAEELTTAADKLDALAAAASHGPWIEAGVGEFGWSVIGGDFPLTSGFGIETEDNDQGKADAAYVAAMNPLIGKALADMLRRFAEAVERKWRVFHEMWKTEQRVRMCADEMPGLHEALAIARLINGSGS